MREFTLLLCLVGCSAYIIKVPTSNIPTQPRIAPLGWVYIQKLLLPLFDNVCEESTNAMVVKFAKDFTFDASNGEYMKPDVIENLRKLSTGKGLLPKGDIFTEYNVDHMYELNVLYEVFVHARDFDTFYKVAAWARQNVNCGLFVDAIYLAIVNRKDTAKVSVPAPYELLPNYFINKDVVVKASFLLTADAVSPTPETDVKVEGNSYVIDANYTTEMKYGDEDSKLAYFREDIGLNSYYFIRKLRNVPWFNIPNNVNSLYGEHMFMMMKQFAARYDLERYAHGIPELEGFDWGTVIAYDPMLIYSNGNEFDHRTFSGVLSESEDVTFVRTIENNLSTVVNHLIQAGHTKAQILNHLMEILVTSDKSYETLCRRLLGYDKDLAERHYSVLEHYMTTFRDPIFWKINKKMVQLITDVLKVLPSYSRNELYFPGVEVLNLETKKMVTSFDKFQFDVTDSLKSSTANTTFQVKIEQSRLNHKPFTIKLNISSLVTKKGFVKIFIGPTMMPGELATKKHLFVLLDLFEVYLKRGYNVISRSSEEMTSFSDDFVSLRALRKKVENTEFGLDALPLDTVESQIGYPSRLILPRGLSEGLPLQVFVFVAPLTKATLTGSLANMEANTAVLSPGYPLDLPIEIRQLFSLPNSLVREVTVIHKSEAAKSDYGSRPGGQSGGGGRPDFGGKPGGGGRPDSNNYDFDQTHVTSQDKFDTNGGDYKENFLGNMVDDVYNESLLVHGLLGDRPDYTYRKTDNTNYAVDKNQYRRKEDYMSKRTDKFDITSRMKYNTATKADLDQKIPVVVTNDKHVDILPIHGLLGARPDFTYKKADTTSYADKKNQYRKKENYPTNTHDKSHGTPLPNYNTTEIVTKGRNVDTSSVEGFAGDVAEDYMSSVYTILPQGLLRASTFDNDKKTNELTGKKYQYLKKEEERTAKREQKKDKYTTKGEEKKVEYVAKREQKKEENIAKREKHLLDLSKKEINKNTASNNFDEALNYDEISKPSETAGEVNILDYENDNFYLDSLQSHGLLGKSEKDTTGYKSKMYQFKKKKQEYDPKKMHFKKVDYREDVIVKEDKNSNNPLKNKQIYGVENEHEQNTKYISEDNNLLMQGKEDKNIDGDISNGFVSNTAQKYNTKDNKLNQNYIMDQETGFNKDILLDIDVNTAPTKNKDDQILTNDISKVENKKVHMDIFDNDKGKNIHVDKEGKITKKDIVTKTTTSAADKDKIISSKSEEESEELNYFTIRHLQVHLG